MTNSTDPSSSNPTSTTPGTTVIPIRPAKRPTATGTGEASSSKPSATATKATKSASQKQSSLARKAVQPHTTASAGVGNMRILRDPPGKNLTQFDQFPSEDHFVELAESDRLFVVMSHCLSIALQILEHPRGRAALIQGGKQYVAAKSGQGVKIAYEDSLDKMGERVDDFLKRVRGDFPTVFITSTVASDGATRPSNWGDNQDEFNPKLAAIMKFNKRVCTQLFLLSIQDLSLTYQM